MKYILWFIVGGISGYFAWIASFLKYLTIHKLILPDFIYQKLNSLNFRSDFWDFFCVVTPGFIFGLFTLIYLWNMKESYKKILIWFFACGFSYMIAYAVGLGIAIGLSYSGVGHHTNDLNAFLISFVLGGLAGSGILLFAYTKLFGSIPRFWIHLTYIIGGLIPGILLLLFGLDEVHNGWGKHMEPSPIYMLWMMIIWQGVMLTIFMHLITLTKDYEKIKQ